MRRNQPISAATAQDTKRVPTLQRVLRVALTASLALTLTAGYGPALAQDHEAPKAGDHGQAGGAHEQVAPGVMTPKSSVPTQAPNPFETAPAQPTTEGDAHGSTPSPAHAEDTHTDKAHTDNAHTDAEHQDGHHDGDHSGASHKDGGHGASGNGGEAKHEESVNLHPPTWITGFFKQVLWHRGPATVKLAGALGPDGQPLAKESLIGQTVSFDYVDPHHPGHPEAVTAKISDVGGKTDAHTSATATIGGQQVTMVEPEVTWTLQQMFPEPLIIAWITMISIMLVALWMVKNPTRIPSRKQALAEIIYSAMDGFVAGLIPGGHHQKYVPLALASFLFVFCMNVAGLIPGWASPTANINITAGMALVVVAYVQYEGIRVNGIVGYLKHFVGEPAWLFPLNIPLHVIGEVAKLLSLTIRLFGNLFGEDVVIIIILFLSLKFFGGFPMQTPMYFLGVFTCLVQALVFTILTCVYISLMTSHDEGHGHEHDDHGHDHGHSHDHGHAHAHA